MADLPPPKKVVLAYSGGLDTLVAVKWLQETYGCEIVTFTADLGQGEELRPAREKALAMGVKPENIFMPDLREEFVRDYVFPMFRANTVYEGQYLLGHLDRPAAHRQDPDRHRPPGGRRRRQPRRHRQGQRPGALRGDLLRARARHPGDRGLARMAVQGPRRRGGLRRPARHPGRQGQAQRAAVQRRRQPAALVVRGQRPGGPVGSRSRVRPPAHHRPRGRAR